MANAPSLASSYVTLVNADAVNTGVTEWDAATDAQKNIALSYGRQFIDSKYNCESFDVDDAPSEIQMANALFAVEYLKGTLFTEAVANVLESDVKAGDGVGVKTKFARSSGTSVVDPYPAISSILFGYCKIKSSGLSISEAIRS
jgi:hypothetical protein